MTLESPSAAVLQKKEIWTIEAVIDELSLCLIKTRDGSVRKYEQQARRLIYKIPIYRPTPFFIVDIADLTSTLKQELSRLEEESLEYVMREAIGRIFEQVDERYFLLNVRPLLRWKLE